MVDTFGKDIINAYTNGKEVKEIYSNGVLVWPTLPDGYKRLKYIYGYVNISKSAENPTPIIHIKLDTEVFTPQSFTITAKIMRTAKYLGKTYPIALTVHGVVPDSDTTYLDRYIGEMLYEEGRLEDTAKFTDSGKYTTNEIVVDKNKYYTLEMTPTESYVNGELLREDAVVMSSWDAAYVEVLNLESCHLWFDQNGSNEYIYGVTISNNGVVVMDLVPALNTTTEKAGLYDMINGVFYGKTYDKALDILYA